MIGKCKECGTTIRLDNDDELCVKCRSEKRYNICTENYFYHKRINITLVPYCKLKNKRATKGDGYWICHDCKHYINT